ncbi:MAG: hypothetical protein A2V58_03810 [Candidatus Muproteobacteria bacterium RBG_19FT_COMBO_61_10]|uniref:Uncharacterized protein n=1 Tax=Candidatus Muproteobacteria bacterium RBG_19FT_COMBO_61_10 TaxID=1817761 RepID=A0A1F6UP23_9PROT|nr:MAG: hypothetical protein A2V58_03810 [Candidatus Muproteobacteria bacterium RBG_19FT_COMBO_61_10]
MILGFGRTGKAVAGVKARSLGNARTAFNTADPFGQPLIGGVIVERGLNGRSLLVAVLIHAQHEVGLEEDVAQAFILRIMLMRAACQTSRFLRAIGVQQTVRHRHHEIRLKIGILT